MPLSKAAPRSPSESTRYGEPSGSAHSPVLTSLNSALLPATAGDGFIWWRAHPQETVITASKILTNSAGGDEGILKRVFTGPSNDTGIQRRPPARAKRGRVVDR